MSQNCKGCKCGFEIKKIIATNKIVGYGVMIGPGLAIDGEAMDLVAR